MAQAMNKNQNIITIAKKTDVDQLMQFINQEWKKGHILGINKEYFLYEYGNNDLLNFVISKNNNEINGMLGFIRSSSDAKSSAWTTMWKVTKVGGDPMLGVSLLNFLRNQGYQSVLSSGINSSTKAIYKYLDFHVGELCQYFISNDKLENYSILAIPKERSFYSNSMSRVLPKKFSVRKISQIELGQRFNFNKTENKPHKDFEYFKHRFYQHPYYEYDVYGAFKFGELISFLIVRICAYEESTCIRIVDFYGAEEALGALAEHLKEIMYQDRHEYIDFFCLGISQECLIDAGFCLLDSSQSTTIVPNYFEPFVQSNISISYFIDNQNLDGLRIFKADGDQDRPSLIRRTL